MGTVTGTNLAQQTSIHQYNIQVTTSSVTDDVVSCIFSGDGGLVLLVNQYSFSSSTIQLVLVQCSMYDMNALQNECHSDAKLLTTAEWLMAVNQCGFQDTSSEFSTKSVPSNRLCCSFTQQVQLQNNLSIAAYRKSMMIKCIHHIGQTHLFYSHGIACLPRRIDKAINRVILQNFDFCQRCDNYG